MSDQDGEIVSKYFDIPIFLLMRNVSSLETEIFHTQKTYFVWEQVGTMRPIHTNTVQDEINVY